MQGDELRCLEAGKDAYATKPIEVGQLFGAIARVMGVRTERRKSA